MSMVAGGGIELPSSVQARKHAPHRLDAGEIATGVVISTPLTDKQTKTAPRVVLARPGAAEVDHRRQILLLLERSGGSAALQSAGYSAVQVGGSELDGVSRHDPCIEVIEPARSQLVPSPILNDDVIMNAVAPRLNERAICNLIHPHRARARPVHLERLLRQ